MPRPRARRRRAVAPSARRVSCLAAAALFLAAGAGAEPLVLRAERITAGTAERLRVGGPDAIGGVGDWWLANDRIEAVIDDVSREHGKNNHGGTLVDLGLRGVDDEDQFARLFPIVNLSQRVSPGYDAVRAEVDAQAGRARVVVTGSSLRVVPRGGALARALDPFVPEPESLASVRAETVYEVRTGEPFVRIATTLTNDGAEPAPVFAFGDVWMRGGRSARAFLGDVLAPERAPGFALRAFSRDLVRSTDALTRFTHVSLVGAPPPFPPVSYALYAPARAARGLPLHGLAGGHVNVVLAFVGEPLRDPGLWDLARALGRELAPGASWTWERRLLVGGRRDVASTTDVVFRELGWTDGASGVEGSVDARGRRAAVLVETAEGAPVTHVAVEPADPPDTQRAFRALLPPGRYRVRLRAEHAAPRVREVEVPAGGFARVDFGTLPPRAWLVFAPAFADGGPGRVVVRGLDGTPDPLFGDDLLDARIDGRRLPSGTAADALHFLGNAHDPRAVAIAPGRYALHATRGLEWSTVRTVVEVPADGVSVRVAPFALERLAPLDGYVSADLHVHAQASDDSATPNEARLRHFVAEGVDVLVATDHDHVPDYAPALARLDVADRIRVVRGVEVTSSAPSEAAPWTIGHHNAWPVPRAPHVHRGGAPPSQNRGAGALYSELRAHYGARVVQLNHPRPRTPGRMDEGHYLSHLGVGTAFDPRRPLGDPPNRALLAGEPGARPLDFDAIEVMNGSSRAQYLAVRADWHALLRQGVHRTATANSDTHGPDETAAYPRNYVRVADGASPAAFDAALREGRSFGTTGPLVRRFSVNGAGMGDTVAAHAGGIRVAWAVDAAPWVPVDEIRILANGEVVRVLRERRGEVALPLRRDAFVTLEAGAPLDADPEAWIRRHPGPYTEVLAPGFVSAAFTNPVFVDADGNGRFDPPGLPPPPGDWPAAEAAALGLALVGIVWVRHRRVRTP